MNKIIVQKDQARLYGQPHPIPQGQAQFSEIEFSFSEEWANLRKIAQFEQKSGTYNVDISDNKCFCPSELVKGWVNIRVKGYPEDTTSSVIATANEIILPVSMGFKSGGTPSVPPTPDLYQRLLSKIQTQIGDLRNLATNDKENLVSAINEAARTGGGGGIFEINAESGSQINDYEYQVTLDKTYEEIDAAFQSGRTPIVILDNRYRLPIISIATGYRFGAFSQLGPGMYGIFDVYVSNREEWLLELPLVDYANFVPFVENVEATIGDLSTLQTTTKDNLVAAINEVALAVAVKGTFYVTVTQGDGNSATADKTAAEVYAAYAAGYAVYAIANLNDDSSFVLPLAFALRFLDAVVLGFAVVGSTSPTEKPLYIAAGCSGRDWSVWRGTLARTEDIPTIPTALKNPNALTIKIGSTAVTYDGSTAQTVTISDGTEVSY